jgi:hypothetical protein
MKLTITAVDEPSELDGQVPIVVDLIRMVPTRARPDYWLGVPRKSIVWLSRTGRREIGHVLLVARHEGRPIVSGARGLLVALEYILEPGAIDGDRLDHRNTFYAAIATVDVD